MGYTKYIVQSSDVDTISGVNPISGIDSNNKRWVFFKKYKYTIPSGIYPYIKNSVDGITWSDALLLYSARNEPQSISLDIDSANNIHTTTCKSSAAVAAGLWPFGYSPGSRVLVNQR